MHASRVTRTVLAAGPPRPRNLSSFLVYESIDRPARLPNHARRCPGCCTRLVFKDRLARMYATVVDEGSRSEPGRQKRGLDDKAASGAGVGKQAYPYPTHPNPTPHQIFHLPYGASQTQIKARYYDLVRSHHPDSFHSKTLPPSIAHARFRQIKASYDFLRGHTLSPHPNARQAPQPREFDPYLHELARRRRAREASSGQTRRPNTDTDEAFAGSGSSNHGFTSAWTRGGFDGFGAHRDDRSNWNPSGRNERIILGCGVFTLLVGLFPDLPFVVYDAFVPPVGIVDGSVSVSRKVGDSDENQKSKGVVDKTKVEVQAQGLLSSSSSLVPISPPSSESTPNLPPIANTNAISNPDGPVFSENEVSTTTGYGFFTAGPDKAHRSAVAALKQARYERTEMGLGVERREGVKKRVAEIKAQKEQQQEGDSSESS